MNDLFLRQTVLKLGYMLADAQIELNQARLLFQR